MIDNKSFDLYNQLVKDNKYNNLFDITIIYQVSETLNNEDIELEKKDFKSLCNEVKKDYLKYDIDLNDNLVMNCYDKLERLETGTYTNSNELEK